MPDYIPSESMSSYSAAFTARHELERENGGGDSFVRENESQLDKEIETPVCLTLKALKYFLQTMETEAFFSI